MVLSHVTVMMSLFMMVVGMDVIGLVGLFGEVGWWIHRPGGFGFRLIHGIAPGYCPLSWEETISGTA